MTEMQFVLKFAFDSWDFLLFLCGRGDMIRTEGRKMRWDSGARGRGTEGQRPVGKTEGLA